MKVGKQISDTIFQKIHNEGYKFIAISVFITFVLLLISKVLGFIGLLTTIWVYYFFRDPDRVSIKDQDYLVSPADGLITQIVESNGPKEFSLENKKFTWHIKYIFYRRKYGRSIYMTIENTHKNTYTSISFVF